MIKSALIIGLAALALAVGASLISPLCVPCLALFAGLAAGYLTGTFEKPSSNANAAKRGTLAGVIGGIGALLGQAIGAAINASMVGPDQALELMRQWGFDTQFSGDYETSYWLALAGSACCMGILDVVLMAGLGALGGLLWWQITGKTNTISSDI